METTLEQRIKHLHGCCTDQNFKAVMADLFKDVIIIDPYLKACEKLGLTPAPELSNETDELMISADAFYRLAVCIEAKNLDENGKPWARKYDGDEPRYYNVFEIVDNGPSGLGLVFYGTYYWYTRTRLSVLASNFALMNWPRKALRSSSITTQNIN